MPRIGYRLFGIWQAVSSFAGCAGEEKPEGARQKMPKVEEKAQTLEFQGEMGTEEAGNVGRDENGLPLELRPEELQAVRITMTEEERLARIEQFAQRRPRGIPTLERRSPEQIQTDRVVADAAIRPANEVVELMVVLSEPGFDFARLAKFKDDANLPPGLNYDDAVAVVVDERRQQLDPVQNAFVGALRGQGGNVVSRYWLANMVSVEVPAARVGGLLQLPHVVGLAPNAETKSAYAYYSGLETNNEMRAVNLKNLGYDAGNNGRADGGRMRAAVIESGIINNKFNCLQKTHHTFADIFVGPPVRVKSTKVCLDSCEEENCNDPNPSMHGTHVAGALLGLNFGGMPGWIANEADLYYYRAANSDQDALAIQDAVATGADVINISKGVGNPEPACDMTSNLSNLNVILRNAMDAGAIPVAAAGNSGHEPLNANCTASYYGMRPESLTVGGLNTTLGSEYYVAGLASWSSQGGGTITVSGINHTNAIAGLDLTAPGYLSGVPDLAPQGVADASGTSMSSSLISGSVLLLRDAFADYGWHTDARLVQSNMDLLGNRYHPAEMYGPFITFGNTNYRGFSNLVLHAPVSADLTAPWSWGWRRFNISQGEIVCHTMGTSGPESNLITQLTANMRWYETDFTNAADIVFYIQDRCPTACAEGGNPLWVEDDFSYDIAKGIRISDNTKIGGHCLEMVTEALVVPNGGTRTVYRYNVWHSGDPNTF